MDKKAFVKAVRNWDAKVVKAVLAQDPGLAQLADPLGKTPLHHCAEISARKYGLNIRSSLKTAGALLDAGADVNAVRIIIDDGEEFPATPLWYAVAWGKNFELAELLLDRGAQADNNAIGSAIWDQNLELADLLRLRGGHIDHVFRGEPPLLRTIRAKRLQLLDWLVEHGADINFQDPSGYSGLHYAVKGTHSLAHVAELLNHGANPDLKARDASTPVSIAIALGKKKLAEELSRSTLTARGGTAHKSKRTGS
jgi:uncharacterized protein